VAIKKKTAAKPKKKAAARKSTIDRLVEQAEALGAGGIVMPIDEIQLGFRLSEQPRRSVLPRLLALAEHANMHARRVGLTAMRRMEAWDDERVFEAFLRGLGDPEGWVRYDAAWALGDSGTRDRRAITALTKLAKKALSNPPLSDGAARAAAQAAESLAALQKA
jgi:HEAT repeat protein